MNLSWYTRLLLALASGLTLALCFPNYNLSLLAWLSVGLLVLACYKAPMRVAVACAFLHAFTFYPVSLPWVDEVMQKYGKVDPLTSAGLLGLFGVAGGIVCMPLTLGVALASKKSAKMACTLAPFVWVSLEFLRSHLPIIAFPWNLTGYAATGSLALTQLTAITGIWGLSFVVAAFGSLVAYAVIVGRQIVWKATITVAGALILIAGGGRYLVPHAQARYVAHLVQTNFPQSYEYPADWLQTHARDLDELEQISISAAVHKPGLIVWPEVPAPFSLQDQQFAPRATRMARTSGSDLLIGVEDWKRDAAGKWTASNSAVLLDPSARRVFTYDKIHLVPWGEYVPLRHLLAFAGKLTADIGDFTPGTEYRVGNIPGGTFGTFICYEAVFPELVRRFTANGAELLITISNDGWFGRSAAPAQHLMMARVRAVESRRWLLRDTNNGYTVDVDPYGRIVAELPTDVRGQLDAPYDFRTGLTLYARFGDWFAWLSVIASVALFALAFVARARAA